MFTILSVFMFLSYARCELFTSLATMENGLIAEQAMADKIRDYITNEKQRLLSLERIADSFATHSKEGLRDPGGFLGNPINAYIFVKKFTIDWDKHIEESLKHKQTRLTEKFNQEIDELRESLPDDEDFTGSIQAILRLQDVYDIPAKQIAEGNISGITTRQLSAGDCFEIGRIAYEDGDYYHGFHWMYQAKQRLQQDEEQAMDMVEILDYLAWNAHELGNHQYALETTEELLKLDPEHIRAKNNRLDFIKIIKDEKEGKSNKTRFKRDLTDTTNYTPKPASPRNDNDEYRSYKRLCKGIDIKPKERVSQLVCRYRDNKHPLLILAPIKEEQVYRDASMVLFHDIASDDEIAIIKTIATPRLNRATVHDPKTHKLVYASYRITKTAWLKPADDKAVVNLHNRIKAVTGLDLDSADDLQVANYGVGGHYDTHYDFSTRDDEDKSELEKRDGNRIATFLLYMTDVDAGGATVFPQINVRVSPKKGAAVFWYNLRRSGKGIMTTKHAACPVLKGIKWVSNKWIRTRGQEFRRPCGLTVHE